MAHLRRDWSFNSLIPISATSRRLLAQPSSTTSPSQDAPERIDNEITTPQARALQRQSRIQQPAERDPSVSRCAFLLEMAQHTGSKSVSVSPELLASLLASVDRLRQETVVLKNEVVTSLINSSAAHTLGISRLRAGSATFTLFPKLPLELRRKVWLAALFTPQVVSLHHVRRYNRSDARNELKFVPSAPRCRINQVCREARDEAMRVQFRLCPYLGGQPNFFFNYEADTIWLSNRALSEDEAESDTFGLDEYLDFGKKHVRLAIDEHFWHRIFQSGRNEDDYQWPFMHLTELGVEEVMVVIGDCEVVRHSGQIAFTTPRGSPDDFGIVPLDRDVFETNPTWANIGEQEIQRLRDFQAVRAEARQEMFDGKYLQQSSSLSFRSTRN